MKIGGGGRTKEKAMAKNLNDLIREYGELNDRLERKFYQTDLGSASANDLAGRILTLQMVIDDLKELEGQE